MTTHPQRQVPHGPDSAEALDDPRIARAPFRAPDRPPLEADDSAFVRWLRSLFDSDGALRLRRLVIVDEGGEERIVLQRHRLRAEVSVNIPSAAGESTKATLYADNGDQDDLTVEPSLGFEVFVGGNQAYTIDVCPDRWGNWETNVVEDSREAHTYVLARLLGRTRPCGDLSSRTCLAASVASPSSSARGVPSRARVFSASIALTVRRAPCTVG